MFVLKVIVIFLFSEHGQYIVSVFIVNVIGSWLFFFIIWISIIFNHFLHMDDVIMLVPPTSMFLMQSGVCV